MTCGSSVVVVASHTVEPGDLCHVTDRAGPADQDQSDRYADSHSAPHQDCRRAGEVMASGQRSIEFMGSNFGPVIDQEFR